MQNSLLKRLSGRKFQPSLWPTLAYIVFMLLLLSLGNWQLERANEKGALFTAFKSGDTAAMRLENALEKAQPRYQRVQLTGHFVSDKQYLLDNIVHRGQVGLSVLTPFKTDAGQTIIVNRGWIPLSEKHGPVVELANLLEYSAVKVSLSGRLDKMLRPGLLLETEIPDTVYPKTVQFPTFEQLSADLDTRLVAWQLLMDAQQPDSNVTGYVREWTPNEMGPERHIGYAVQWFALALTLTIIYLVLNFRIVRQDEIIANNEKNFTE